MPVMSTVHNCNRPSCANLAESVKRLRFVFVALIVVLAVAIPHLTSMPISDTSGLTDSSEVSSEYTSDDSFVMVDTYSEDLSASVLDAFKNLESPAAKISSSGVVRKLNGKKKYRFPNGDVYSGQWKNGKMSGKGTYTFANKSKVVGTFKNNKFVSGTYRVISKRGKYTFTIKKRTITRASIVLKTGFRYAGGYKNAHLNGKGKAVYPSGDRYNGSFKSGARSGSGTYVWRDGSKYTGSWSNDLMNGKGTYFYSKSSTAAKLTGTFYKNHPSGKCMYYLKNGKHYTTFWANGKCTGVS